MIKISTPGGKFFLIATRAEAAQFGARILVLSTTEPQPYATLHHTADGRCIGGSTITDGYRKKLLDAAKINKWPIEEVGA